ncbi:MAG: zf-HC2 domain-containing protein [Armatimonadota bacterium]
MSCPFSPEDISAYTDGELGEGDEEKLKHHLQHCAACASIADSLAALSRTLRSRPRAELQHSLAERVLAAAAERPAPQALNCKAAQEAASAYLDAELEPRVAERLEAHLMACAQCAEQFELLRLCVPAPPAVRPVPAGMRQRILATVAEQRRGPFAWLAEVLAPLRLPTPAPVRAWAPALALACAALLAWAVVLPRLAPEAPTPIAERPAPAVEPPPTGASLAPEAAPAEGGQPSPRPRPRHRVVRVPKRAAEPPAPAAPPDERLDLTSIFEGEVTPPPDPRELALLMGGETPENATSVGSGPLAVAEAPPEAEPHIGEVSPPGAGEHDSLTPDVPVSEDSIWGTTTS